MPSFWILSVWLFSAILAAALVCTSVRRIRYGKPSQHPRSSPPSQAPLLAYTPTANPFAQGGPLPHISWDGLLNLCEHGSELMVIDLRDGAQLPPLPVLDSIDVLPVRLHELIEVLELVAADKVVVFYGVSDLGMLLIETSSFMQRPASTYVLDLDATFLEVA